MTQDQNVLRDAPTRMTSILCATDFSEPARAAAERAAHLARETGAGLTLMHVVSGGRLAALRRRLAPGDRSGEPPHPEIEQRLQQLAGELSTAWQVDASTVHAVGSVADEVIFEASALKADVLVVGARGAGTLRRLLLGTTAERLLRRSTRPVLLVRQPPDVPYGRVLVAVDFSASSQPVLAMARRMAPRATLVLLHVLERDWAPEDAAEPHAQAHQAEAARKLQALADDAGLAPGAWEARIVDGAASEQVLEHERDCSLVVLGKHGRTLTEDLLLGSVTQHVIADGTTDLLVSTQDRA